jgi:leucyl aminopeptidase (aminopeptidase T)
MDRYEFELGKAAEVVATRLFRLKPEETLVITADTESDWRVISATARAAFAVGAKPMVIITASPLGVGKAADPLLPMAPLSAALRETDAWVEFNNQWLLYSTPFDIAVKENKKLRHLCLVGMNADMMVRCIGRVDFAILQAFQETLTALIDHAKHTRITTPSGGDVQFDHNAAIPARCRLGYAHAPSSEMLAGQISQTPVFESIHGKIVFDGATTPPCGRLESPIELTVESGTIVRVTGGGQARQFEAWIDGFGHPQMRRLAHLSYGCNPGAKLTGDILEDERVWGATEWGVGNVGASTLPPNGIPAPSHSDGICLSSSVWLDGRQIMDRGRFVEPRLADLARKLGKE